MCAEKIRGLPEARAPWGKAVISSLTKRLGPHGVPRERCLAFELADVQAPPEVAEALEEGELLAAWAEAPVVDPEAIAGHVRSRAGRI